MQALQIQRKTERSLTAFSFVSTQLEAIPVPHGEDIHDLAHFEGPPYRGGYMGGRLLPWHVSNGPAFP